MAKHGAIADTGLENTDVNSYSRPCFGVSNILDNVAINAEETQ